MPPANAHIVALGMACPVGLHSKAALAAMRAGITRFTEVDDLIGPGGAVRASMLARLGSGASRTERAATFAVHALQETVANLGDLGDQPLCCFLALSEPGVGPRIEPHRLLGALAGVRTDSGMPPRLELQPGGILEAGRAGVFMALERALALLAGGKARFVLVGGIDSLADMGTLEALAGRNRLLGHSNLDGVIPGEGAAFLLLCHPNAALRRRPLAQILALATAQEPLPRAPAAERVSASEGLTGVFSQLRAKIDGRVDHVHAGTTSEAYFGREFSHAYLRNAALMPEPLHCEPISEALGDLGGAAGAICIVQAVARLSAPRRALVYASSDTGLVGACVIAAGS